MLLFCRTSCACALFVFVDPNTILQELKDLKALNSDGFLSNDEFLAQKDELLKELMDL